MFYLEADYKPTSLVTVMRSMTGWTELKIGVWRSSESIIKLRFTQSILPKEIQRMWVCSLITLKLARVI